MGELDDVDIARIKTGFARLYVKNTPSEQKGGRENPECSFIVAKILRKVKVFLASEDSML